MTTEQRKLFDVITSGARGQRERFEPLVDVDGRLAMPFAAMLLSPRVGLAVQALGSAIRFESEVPDRLREVVTLAVAVETGCEHEWRSHAFLGARAGLTPEQLTAIREQMDPPGLELEESIALAFARTVLATNTVPYETVQQACETLGAPRVFELLTIVGYYRLLAGYFSLGSEGQTPDTAG